MQAAPKLVTSPKLAPKLAFNEFSTSPKDISMVFEDPPMFALDLEPSCPVCIDTLSNPVQLHCGHSLCGECASQCGESGHRRCPVCREPHLLNPKELSRRNTKWREEYQKWRSGEQKGAKKEHSSITTASMSRNSSSVILSSTGIVVKGLGAQGSSASIQPEDFALDFKALDGGKPSVEAQAAGQTSLLSEALSEQAQPRSPTLLKSLDYSDLPLPEVAPMLPTDEVIPVDEKPLPMDLFHRRVAPLKSALARKGKALRGVPQVELERRLARAQALMEEQELDSILLTTEQDFFYFTGLPSRFWNSPTRPFFLLVPREGLRPVAVIPSIMEYCIVSRTWIPKECVHTWAAPQPEDDGVSLLASTIANLPRKFNKVGFQMGPETCIRMPLADVDRVRSMLTEKGVSTVDGREVMLQLRLIKSDLEIARCKHAAAIASAAFVLFPTRLHALRETKAITENTREVSEREARDAMKLSMLEFGADDIAYVMAQSGQGGYDNIVLEPRDTPLVPGDVLVIDTGITFEGYWCDFDRNWIVGSEDHLPKKSAECHDMLWRATEAGFAEAGKEGATSTTVFRAMARECGIPDDAADDAGVGRFGHGLGLQLTELFSNNATDNTPLEPGFVMTLEPSALIDPKAGDEMMLAHEEDIAITDEGAVWLSHRAPRQMPVILSESNDADPMPELHALCDGLMRDLDLC
jgi:Xaa-Pro dipeptidase